jgi:hypothetical protein
MEGRGRQEIRPRVHHQRYSLPDMGVDISGFGVRYTGLGPFGPSRTHAAASTAFEAALEGHG